MSYDLEYSAECSLDEYFDFDKASTGLIARDAQFGGFNNHDIPTSTNNPALTATISNLEPVSDNPFGDGPSDDPQLWNYGFNEGQASNRTFTEMSPTATASSSCHVGHEVWQRVTHDLENNAIMPSDTIGQASSIPDEVVTNQRVLEGANLAIMVSHGNE
ncbi:hypothetical protein MMC14_002445 [Varicellaria rhodocarpa]|nr:hypothetical protein [Varicellaria rhodocarpa]